MRDVGVGKGLQGFCGGRRAGSEHVGGEVDSGLVRANENPLSVAKGV